MTKEIETLKAKILKLPTMSMELFDNVLENIDEDYPFSLSPKLILALLIFTGICVIAIGIIFIWYKRKTSLTSSTVGNLIKLVPSLNEKISTLNSLLPILSELTPHIMMMLFHLSLFLTLHKPHWMSLYYPLHWFQNFKWKLQNLQPPYLFHTNHPDWNHPL